jgi:hypothetical protein
LMTRARCISGRATTCWKAHREGAFDRSGWWYQSSRCWVWVQSGERYGAEKRPVSREIRGTSVQDHAVRRQALSGSVPEVGLFISPWWTAHYPQLWGSHYKLSPSASQRASAA